ncbi:MAG: pyridoxal phosphate-dependent aminotransferase, partial [Hyphomicrobiales bacterium]
RERLDAVSLGYPGLDGSAPLRQAISGRYPDLVPDQVLATSGLDDAIALMALTLIEPGDRVIVQTPAYQTYLTVPAWRGAEVVEWKARPGNDWLPDLDELAAMLETPARWVMINFPNNPTGVMPDGAYFTELLEIVGRNGTLLISDEIYAGLPPSDPPFVPLCCRYERALSLHSVSKTLGVPGLRIGWIATRYDDVLARLKNLRLHFNSFIGAPSEFLGALALRHDAEIHARNAEILAGNLEIAQDFFARHDNVFGWTAPRAGVNAWPEWRGPGDTKTLSDTMLADAKLLIAHSALFDAGDRNVRLGLGCRGLDGALERFDDFLGRAYT